MCRCIFVVSEVMVKFEFKEFMKDLEFVEGDEVVFDVRVIVRFDFEV